MMPYGWHDGAWGVLWMIVSWAVIIAIAIWIVRSFASPGRTDADPDPERILEQRFARGEISEAELLERRRTLQAK